MTALILESPMVDYTSNTFCYISQGISMPGFFVNYGLGAGEEYKIRDTIYLSHIPISISCQF